MGRRSCESRCETPPANLKPSNSLGDMSSWWTDGDGEEPKRRNSVSQQNLADFTDAFQDANRASAEEF